MSFRKSFTCNLLLSLLYLAVVSFTNSCNSEKPASTSTIFTTAPEVFTLESPQPNARLLLGDAVPVRFSSKDSIIADSVVIYSDGNWIHPARENANSYLTTKATREVGYSTLQIRIYYSQGKFQNIQRNLIITSNKVPVEYSYQVLRTFPHDKNDYTQGYIYKDGFLYEGTGQNGHSRLIKVDPENGKVLKEHKLESAYFGEGITLLNDQIYQITWKKKKGFVYNPETFDKIREFTFNTRTEEGWGLTNDGTDLIVSDGSARLYYFDPENLVEKRMLFVANDKGNVHYINELEYKDGFVWANILYQKVIVKIDLKTGAVIGRVNLSKLFPKGMPLDGDHVLNGIAYNPDHDSYFITGKYWPSAYEIKIAD